MLKTKAFRCTAVACHTFTQRAWHMSKGGGDYQSLLVQQLDYAGLVRAPLQNKPVYILSDADKASNAVRILYNAAPVVLGFDTETTVGRKEHPQAPSLLQLATSEACLLIQLYRISKGDPALFPPPISRLLGSPRILKVGCNGSLDALLLETSYGVKTRGVIDIEMLAIVHGIPVQSLADMYEVWGDDKDTLQKAHYSGKVGELDGIFEWDWEGEMRREMIEYASKDAFASLTIFQNMMNWKRKAGWVSYEKRRPMTKEEELEDVWTFISANRKGQFQKMQTLLQWLRNSYPRYQKTKVEPDRTQALIGNLRDLAAQGRFFFVGTSLPTNSTPSDSSESRPLPLSDAEFLAQTYQVPGQTLHTLLSNMDPNILREVLPAQEAGAEDIASFVIKLSRFLEHPMRVGSMVRQVMNEAVQQRMEKWDDKEWIIKMLKLLGGKGLVKMRVDGKVEFDEIWVEKVRTLAQIAQEKKMEEIG
ncbi:ribonuclease H-like domain-containing protein [Endogone sp. FLAS-F59071]|nr:ribonuclease H-like domain-containing protein [Endogone sp. FLAS-F59071]|eukprot:RUS15257.1 ribonuclease H-like domain-containing protein [Endogone sp. FLAS-F59071]